MIALDETALICDLAETYHVLDYKALRPSLAATLAVGLDSDSRIKRKMSGSRYKTDTYLSAAMVDRLSLMVWAQTKDGQKGRKRPQMILELMKDSESDAATFASIEEYEAARAKLIKGE